jgi:signal transduction histidine kinase
MISGVILLSFFYQYLTKKMTALEWAKDKAVSEISLLASEISMVLTGVTRDLFMLRDFPELQRYLNSRGLTERINSIGAMEKFFLVFAEQKKIYDQVRFIDEKGMEVVRVNYDGEKAVIVGREGLQDKSRRYYFEETIKLDHGTIFVSPMDLNIEHGIIEKPYKPMIRYATPVFDGLGKKRGIVVLNFKAESILNVIRKHQKGGSHGEQYYLLNRDGYYLLHPDKRKEWGFMLGNDERLANDEPELASLLDVSNEGFKIIYSKSKRRNYLFAYKRVYPVSRGLIVQSDMEVSGFRKDALAKSQNYWVVLSSVDEKSLVPVFMKHKWSMMIFSGFLLWIGVIFAYFLAWRYSRPIQLLSKTASKIAGGDFSVRVDVSSQNEIGRLGRVFNEMAEALKKRQDQEKIFQRRLREEIVLAQEKERRVLAQDIHDHLGQGLALVKMKTQEAQSKLPDELSDVQMSLGETATLLDQMIKQTRTLIFDLYPIMLDDFGIVATIEWHVQEFSTRTGLAASFVKVGSIGEPPRSVSLLILRVLKEILNNSFKHAEANEVKVTIHGKEDLFGILVEDDGKGFDPENFFSHSKDLRGIGLFSIREWVTGLGGYFSIDSKPGSGTRVLIEIPIKNTKEV